LVSDWIERSYTLSNVVATILFCAVFTQLADTAQVYLSGRLSQVRTASRWTWKRSGYGGQREKSMESMRAAIIAKLVMIVKTKPADSKPSIISTKAMSELIDKVEEAVPGWVKKQLTWKN
jgi:hypothetical protein